jgi:hypothetical protein
VRWQESYRQYLKLMEEYHRWQEGLYHQMGVLPGHHVDDAFDLLDVRLLMASQPPRIEQHVPFEYLSRPGHFRRA